MGPTFAKTVTAPVYAPQAVICIDSFHAVKFTCDARLGMSYANSPTRPPPTTPQAPDGLR